MGTLQDVLPYEEAALGAAAAGKGLAAITARPTPSSQSVAEKDRFEIGGEDLLGQLNVDQAAYGDEDPSGMETKRQEVLADLRVRTGTLLKTETVSFLLGAGASVECGGQLIGSVPLAIERALQEEGVIGDTAPRIRAWLKVFYLAVRCAGDASNVPVSRNAILVRRNKLAGKAVEPLWVNFEQVLALLHRWRSALPVSGGRLRIDGSPSIDVNAEDLDKCILHATHALARACRLPITGRENGLTTLRILLRKLLTRPLNLKRVNVFTLNYDTLIEQASDAEGIVLLDGFVGTHRRIFRPESYEQDLYFPAETTEGRVHRFDRVLHLYKLHGSISWVTDRPTSDNPYGVTAKAFDTDRSRSLLVYPTPAKYGETLGMPYSELFRRFAAMLVRPQSVLFVVGYGFGDEHVNSIIRQALAVPSFTLVVVDPRPKSEFVSKLREQKDHRIWIAEGPTLGTLSGFAYNLLPDLRDEEIRKKVVATHRALAPTLSAEGDPSDGD